MKETQNPVRNNVPRAVTSHLSSPILRTVWTREFQLDWLSVLIIALPFWLLVKDTFQLGPVDGP
jgi:hypothetical protein